jgi:hypothetical protein
VPCGGVQGARTSRLTSNPCARAVSTIR